MMLGSVLTVQHADCVACPKCLIDRQAAARLVKPPVSLHTGYEHKLLMRWTEIFQHQTIMALRICAEPWYMISKQSI